MQKSTHLPKWAQWAAGLGLLAVALTAGGLSLVMNWAAGLAIGLAVAVAFGLSDVAKLLIPVTCQAIGWNRHLKAVYIVASVVSVGCASLYLADEFGEAIAAKENRAEIAAATERHIADLRSELKATRTEKTALADQRAPGAVKAHIEAAKQHKRWASTKGCTDATVDLSRQFCRAYYALDAELATAEKAERLGHRVAELETAISDGLRQRQSVKAAEMTDGKAVVIAGALGADEAATARGASLTLIVAALVVGELCAHLAGYAAAMIGIALQRREPVATRSPVVAKLIDEAVATAPKRGTRAYYLQRLQREHPAIAKRVASGELSVYAGSIEAGLRKAPKKASKWTKLDAYAKGELASA